MTRIKLCGLSGERDIEAANRLKPEYVGFVFFPKSRRYTMPARAARLKSLLAETGAGQHGVATATAAALMGMECVVFMGEEDTVRQSLNVYRMRLLGAEVIPVKTGTATLKDAVSEAMREWTSRISDTNYCLGSVMGPHPFPTIVRDFQAVISKKIKEQLSEKEGRLPNTVIA